MAKISWTASQSDAINARDCSLCVSAAAGSGKTAVLTERIIEKLRSGGDISRLLIVTFTNDAANDLRRKIRKALSDSISQDPTSTHMRRQLLKVSGAKISTIDGFCSTLVRANFALVGLPADFSMLSGAEDILLQKNVADELIGDYYEGRVEPHFGVIEDFGAFADTFGKSGNDALLAENISKIYNKLSSSIDFVDTLKKYADALLVRGDFGATPFGEYVLTYVRDFARHYASVFRAFLSYASEREDLEKHVPMIEDDLAFAEKIEYAASSGTPFFEVGKILSSHEFIKKKPSRAKTAREKYFYDSRDDFKKELADIIKDFFSFGEDAPREAAALLSRAANDLYIFIKEYKCRLDMEKRRMKKMSFADIEHAALALVYDKSTGAPTDFARSLSEDFDEIYIDEYQDTNGVQDAIFSSLSRADNRFVVGDIKQSIYAFRNADPSIFEALLERGEKYQKSSCASLCKIFLSQNFRSTDEILAFSNAVFETQMERGRVMSYGADERLYGTGKHGQKVEIAVCVKNDDADTEAEYVAEKIKYLIENEKKLDGEQIRPSDIVILLRTVSGKSEPYIDALARRGIACDEPVKERFFESPEVLLVIALLNVIDNPERDIYLAAVLKSALYGVTLDELLYIRRSYPDGSLFASLKKFTEEKSFKKGLRFLADYERYREKARAMPCDELIWQLYLEKELLSLAFSSDDEKGTVDNAKSNLIQLYNYARDFSGTTFRGIYDFISFISDIVEDDTKIKIDSSSRSSESVKIMSIHKSKGLEFPVCFLCGCGAKINLKDASDDMIIDKEFGVLPYISAESGLVRLATPQRAAASLKIEDAARGEEMRVLYVALTRARERLFVTGTIKETKERRAEDYLIAEHCDSAFSFAGEFFSPYAAKNVGSYFDMILTSVAGTGAPCRAEVVREVAEAEVSAANSSDKNAEDITLAEARKLIRERFSFEYAHSALSSVPSKLSVSRLYPDVLDDDGAADMAYSEDEAAAIPEFMRESTEQSGAARGNATHLFMQFFEFDSLKKLGIAGEIARLEKEKFIFPSDASLIDKRALARFFSSELAEKMEKSPRVYREKRFIINYPAEDFTEEERTRLALSGEELLVQGIIDCAFFDERGELILVDYKTDFFPRGTPLDEAETTLRARHSRQIGYYKYALEKMFGVPCARSYIYSFSLNKTIEI